MTAHARSITGYFDHTFLLNLPDRPDRLRATMQQLNSLDSTAAARVHVFAGIRSADAHGFPSLGAYGCFQGHLGMLRAARALGARNVLLLEDDLQFPRSAQQNWPAVADELRSADWGIVNLGFDESSVVATAAPPQLVRVHGPLMLAHCYAVNGYALTPLIDFLETLQTREEGDPRGGPMHYDGALFHFCDQHLQFARYRSYHSLAGQRSSQSDIAGPRWFDRNPLTRRVVAGLRSASNRLR